MDPAKANPVRLFLYELVCAGGLGADAPESLRREGWAMLRAVAEDFARVPGIRVMAAADDRCPDLPAAVCRLRDGRNLDCFQTYCASADAVLVIAPEFDDLLFHCSRRVIEAGRRLLGSLPAAAQSTGDKLALHQHWQARGIRSPVTRVASGMPPDFAPPWVCKPRNGAGAQATFLVRAAYQWPAMLTRARAEWPGGDLLVQPLVPGIAASVSFLLGPGRCLPLMPAQQRLSNDGRFRYLGGRVPLPATLRDRAVRLGQAALARIAGLQGYVGVDLVLGEADDGSADYAIEINPRVATSYIGLRRLCPDNLAQAWLDVLRGENVKLGWRDGVVEFGADGTVRE